MLPYIYICCAVLRLSVVSCRVVLQRGVLRRMTLPHRQKKRKLYPSALHLQPSFFIKEQIRKVYEKIVPSIFWSSILALLIISKPKNTATFVKSDHYLHMQTSVIVPTFSCVRFRIPPLIPQSLQSWPFL